MSAFAIVWNWFEDSHMKIVPNPGSNRFCLATGFQPFIVQSLLLFESLERIFPTGLTLATGPLLDPNKPAHFYLLSATFETSSTFTFTFLFSFYAISFEMLEC